MQWYDKLPYSQGDQSGEIKKLGDKNLPEEFTDEFEGLEEFYQHYKKITAEV